jgi:hypothetical protein
MSKSSNPDWLKDYYARLQSDITNSLGRRDNVTNWAYSLLGALLAIYFGFFSVGASIPQFWRFALIIGMSVILIRFFFQSMIAYGFFLRWRFLKNKIESHWMKGSPTVNEIISDIEQYDHGRTIPNTGRKRFWDGQIRSGFIIVLIIPLILISYEISLVASNVTYEYSLTLLGLIVYIILDTINFLFYDQMKSSPVKSK